MAKHCLSCIFISILCLVMLVLFVYVLRLLSGFLGKSSGFFWVGNPAVLYIRIVESRQRFRDQAKVADTPTSGIKESVSLQKKAGDKTNCLGEGNLAKEINGNNIVSLATQSSRNQNKIFPGKVIVYIFIPESFVSPSE